MEVILSEVQHDGETTDCHYTYSLLLRAKKQRRNVFDIGTSFRREEQLTL
jgi:hypothetical protein